MTDEVLVADLARRWADRLAPGDGAAAERAVALALRCYEGGASINEAAQEARRFAGSWARHPSHGHWEPSEGRIAS